jgi:peptidoglycan/LPS O-acetylase OafA/YrhL
MDEKQSRHILGLDIVRFAAAMMVMTFHYDFGARNIPGSWTGWVGVEVFFVLSGFVISYSAAIATPAGFCRSRFVRLLPAIWICGTVTALVFVVFSRTAPDLLRRYLNTLVLWPTGPWVDSSYWTLPVEIVFYALVWATLLRWRAPLALENVLRVMALASAAYWSGRAIQQFFPHLLLLNSTLRFIPDAVVTLSMLGFGGYFALGGFLYLSLRDGITLRRFVFIGLAVLAGAIQIVFGASNWIPPGSHKLLPVWVWLGLTAVIAISAWANALIWRVFGRYANAIRLIGLSTYPLYLLHDGIGIFLMSELKIPMSLVMAAMIAVALAFSATIEPATQSVVRRMLGPKRPLRAIARFSDAGK